MRSYNDVEGGMIGWWWWWITAGVRKKAKPGASLEE